MHKPITTQIHALRTGLVLLGLAISQAHAVEPALRSLEDAIESSTDAVVLPAAQSGTLTLRNCAVPCAMKSLRLSEDSRFFVGSSQVSLAEFNAYVGRTQSQFLMIFHEPGKPTITRLMVFGQL